MEIFIFAFIALFIAVAVLGAYQKQKRQKELQAWASAHSLYFSPNKDRSFDERYPEFRELRSGSNRYAFNIMQGDWNERRIQAFDYHYETHSTDSKGNRQTNHHYFSAVIVRAGLPLKPLFIRPEGFFDKLKEFVGFDDIDFESAEFSRRFYVKAPDRRWAYDVLHARTMQFLLESPRYTLQFDDRDAIATDGRRFDPAEFEAALAVIYGILDGFPDYLVRQQKEMAR